MKLKNINVIEQHVEKIVLAIAALFGVYVLLAYVLASPYTVEIGTKDLSPADAETTKKDIYDALLRDMERQESRLAGELRQRKTGGFVEDWNTRRNRPMLETDRFPIVLGDLPGLSADDVTEQEVTLIEYAITIPPPPSKTLAAARSAVLMDRPTMVASLPQVDAEQVANTWAGHVSEAAPRDFNIVTVAAEFDLEQWRQILIEQPEQTRIPESWVTSRLRIADVVLERQVRDPLTGRWPDDNQYDVIAPLPGTVRGEVRRYLNAKAPFDRDATARIDEMIREHPIDIEREPMDLLTEDLPWLPPQETETQLSEKDHRKVYELRKKIAGIEKKLSRLKGRQNKPQPDIKQPMNTRPDQDNLPHRPKPAAVSVSKNQQKEQRELLADLEKKQKEAYRKLDELLGRRPKGQRINSQRMFGSNRPATNPIRRDPYSNFSGREGRASQRLRRPAIPTLAEDETHKIIDVWAHDPTGQPGQTYRYRLRVRVCNPLYQRANLNKQQKQVYHQALALLSQPSAWSDPIAIEPKLQFFFVKAEDNRNSAQVELYHMFGGKRRLQQFRIGPGEPIGAPVMVPYDRKDHEVNVQTRHVMVDVFRRAGEPGTPAIGSIVLIYDTKTAQLGDRIVGRDISNPDRIRLHNEISQPDPLATRSP